MTPEQEREIRDEFQRLNERLEHLEEMIDAIHNYVIADKMADKPEPHHA